MEIQVIVDQELWTIGGLTESEYLLATSGDENTVKSLVTRESERSLTFIAEMATAEPQEVQSDSAPAKEGFTWPEKGVLLLLETYRAKETEFEGDPKRHNKIWAEIAVELDNDGYKVNGTQCQNKMSGLKSTYKHIIDSNKRSGNHATSWLFYSFMDDLFGKKGWVKPRAIASSDGPSSPKEQSVSPVPSRSNSEETSAQPKKRRVEVLLDSYISGIRESVHKEKEERKQERSEKETARAERETKKDERWNNMLQDNMKMHNENLATQKSLINILSQLVNKE